MQELSMPIVNFSNPEAKDEKNVLLSDKVFGETFKEPLIHQVVTAYLAGARAGTRAQKSRSEVRGGGRKPWKQKGTGQARAGTIRSPIWRGGGVTFAAKPQDHSVKVNKKSYAVALRSIFSELLRQGRLLVVDDFAISTHKTKDFCKHLKTLGVEEGLIITTEVDKNLHLASRNLFKISISDVAGINPVNLIRFEKVLLTLAALKKIEEILA